MPRYNIEGKKVVISDDKYKDITLSEVLIPTVKKINDEEFLSALKGDSK